MNFLIRTSGQITSSIPTKGKSNYSSFTWVGEKKSLIVGLGDSSLANFSNISFTIYISDEELSAVRTDNPLKNAIDSVVNGLAARYMIENSIVGLSIRVTRDGKLYCYNYGTVVRGKDQLPTDHTFYDLGSIVKTFTSILIARALIDKKVRLSDDIRQYLPGDYPNLEYRGDPIRLEHLANYTSGLPAGIPHETNNFNDTELRKFFRSYSVADFLADFRTVELDTIPGTRYMYSSSAVALLGAILERVYHKSYAQLVQEFIALPMVMKDTRVTTEFEKDSIRFAHGYGADGVERYWNYGPTIELGDIHSSVHDMLLYILQNIKELDPAVKLSHQQTMQLGIAGEESGLGWFIEPTSRGIQIEKGGNSPRHSSDCVIIREKNIGIICLTNMAGME